MKILLSGSWNVLLDTPFNLTATVITCHIDAGLCSHNSDQKLTTFSWTAQFGPTAQRNQNWNVSQILQFSVQWNPQIYPGLCRLGNKTFLKRIPQSSAAALKQRLVLAVALRWITFNSTQSIFRTVLAWVSNFWAKSNSSVPLKVSETTYELIDSTP